MTDYSKLAEDAPYTRRLTTNERKLALDIAERYRAALARIERGEFNGPLHAIGIARDALAAGDKP